MPLSLRLGLAAFLIIPSLPTWALDILPGLGEITPRGVHLGGQTLPDLGAVLAHLENLPPEQRQNMLDTLSQRGVQLAGRGVRVCLSEEQVRRRDLPMYDAQNGCTQTYTERSEQLWTFSFQCPDVAGQGEARLLSEREFITTLDSQFKAGAMLPDSGRLETHARWLSSDCGTLKPSMR
jgi:hypothetical protein